MAEWAKWVKWQNCSSIQRVQRIQRILQYLGRVYPNFAAETFFEGGGRIKSSTCETSAQLYKVMLKQQQF